MDEVLNAEGGVFFFIRPGDAPSSGGHCLKVCLPCDNLESQISGGKTLPVVSQSGLTENLEEAGGKTVN